MRQAILLLSNHTDCVVLDRYKKLASEYGHKSDVFLLFDQTQTKYLSALSEFDNVFSFTLQGLLDSGYTALKDGFLGNCHYPVLEFHRQYPEYDYCWIVEDDVVFSGEWSVLFDAFVDDPSALVAASIRGYKDDPEWVWWDSLKYPESICPALDELYAAFIPIYRLSSRAMDCLENASKSGWRGHFEAVVPTVVSWNGLELCDMGGKGQFVKKGEEQRFYTEKTHTWVPLRVQKIVPNRIYHPMKEKIRKRTFKHNCVLVCTDDYICPSQWIMSDMEIDFDYHLLIRDFSFGKYYDDADFIYSRSGYKSEVIKDYLKNHEYLLDAYDYFLIIDQPLRMTAKQINGLFDEMRQEEREFSIVDMTMPCFRSDVMKSMLGDDKECSILFY